jgi:hypothetical protein
MSSTSAGTSPRREASLARGSPSSTPRQEPRSGGTRKLTTRSGRWRSATRRSMPAATLSRSAGRDGMHLPRWTPKAVRHRSGIPVRTRRFVLSSCLSIAGDSSRAVSSKRSGGLLAHTQSFCSLAVRSRVGIRPVSTATRVLSRPTVRRLCSAATGESTSSTDVRGPPACWGPYFTS